MSLVLIPKFCFTNFHYPAHLPCSVSSRSCANNCNVNTKQKVQSYLLSKYFKYFKKYKNAIEEKFPRAFHVYRIFSSGFKEFNEDLACLFQVFKKVTLQKPLSRRELEVGYQMPKDMIKVAPVLLITVLPGGGVVFPIAYMFPRVFLSHHFWSLQQRSEFAMAQHRKQLTHFRPVFRFLQAQLRSIKGDREHHSRWSQVLGLLGSGVQPSPDLLLECKPLFQAKPYHLSSISSLHVSHLLQIHGMHRGWWRRTRLEERARLLQRMDRALEAEGGPAALSSDHLRWVCFFRGLNPINVSHKDANEWLHRWLIVSREVDTSSYSLLLHCPVLLGYNEPSNWRLLHEVRT